MTGHGPKPQADTNTAHPARVYGRRLKDRERQPRETHAVAPTPSAPPAGDKPSKPNLMVYLFVVIAVYAVIITAAQMPG